MKDIFACKLNFVKRDRVSISTRSEIKQTLVSHCRLLAKQTRDREHPSLPETYDLPARHRRVSLASDGPIMRLRHPAVLLAIALPFIVHSSTRRRRTKLVLVLPAPWLPVMPRLGFPSTWLICIQQVTLFGDFSSLWFLSSCRQTEMFHSELAAVVTKSEMKEFKVC